MSDRRSLRTLLPLAPAVLWLALFSFAPLVLIFLFSVGHRTEGERRFRLYAGALQRFLSSAFYLRVVLHS